MSADTNKRRDVGVGESTVDLRARLRGNLVEEFRKALGAITEIAESQRTAMSDLVAAQTVTAQTILSALSPNPERKPSE